MLLDAILTTVQPHNLLILMASTVVAIVVGAIPGLTVNMAVALAVPLTIQMGPAASMLMLLALYGAGIYGGSISAILLNAPGTPASAATCLDGYELAKQGQAGKALKMALIASLYGGLFSALLLILVAPQLAAVALRFGPAELAGLLVFSLTIVAVLSERSIVKGVLSAAIGMVLATAGNDPMVSVQRFTFGWAELQDGFAYVPMLIGLFAVAEMFVQAERRFALGAKVIDLRGADREANRITREDLRRCAMPVVRSSLIGCVVGALPGLGSAIATFMGYAEAKRISKRPELFGKGAIEGVAGSEAANNAVTGSALIPLLALSIPGDSVTAILLGALLMQGVAPGPLIFTQRPDMVYIIYCALILSNLAFAVVGYVGLRPMTAVLRVPKVWLYPVILVMCVAGSFAIRSSVFDVFVMLGAGVLGYGLRLFGVPVPPLLIAFILTRPFEESLRQALVKSEGSYLVFVTHPIALFFLILACAAVLLTWRRNRRHRSDDP